MLTQAGGLTSGILVAVIEDLDGADPAPRRGRGMRVLSLVLVAAAAAGYAVAASPLFHGPFAEPRPSVMVTLFTPAPFASAEPAAAHAAIAGCVVPGAVTNATVFINGRTVQVPSLPRATSAFSSCVGFFFQLSHPVPLERLAP